MKRRYKFFMAWAAATRSSSDTSPKVKPPFGVAWESKYVIMRLMKLSSQTIVEVPGTYWQSHLYWGASYFRAILLSNKMVNEPLIGSSFTRTAPAYSDC